MTLTYRVLLIALFIAPALMRAQPAESIHELESRRHAQPGTRASSAGPAPSASSAERRPAPPPSSSPLASRAMPLAKRVFGWVPYWISEAQRARFDWSALTAIGYFSLETDGTGRVVSLRGWPAPALRDAAHAHGVKFILTVTNLGAAANAALLADPARRTALVGSIVDAVASGGGDGVNVDFEGVPGAQRNDLTAFMSELALRMRAAKSDAEISMAIPAVDWSNAFDVVALGNVCDYLIMMGYDYHWRNSPTAGPVAPLAGENLNVTRSVQTYLSAGLAPSKLLLGVPWYGYEWPTADDTRGAAVTGEGRAILYGDARSSAAIYGRLFDEPTSTPWYRFSRRDAWYQGWYDDSLSLGLKYRLVNDLALGGIGIWALGYEGAAVDAWQGIHQAFDLPSSIVAEPGGSGPLLAVDREGLHYAVYRPMHARVDLFDAIGRHVATLVDDVRAPGVHRTPLDTRSLARGLYLIVANTGARTAVVVGGE